MTISEHVAFKAADGRSLTGRVILPSEPKAVMTINAATGYRMNFYEDFARAAAEAGWAAMIYDYRGQGLSRPGTPRDEAARMLDWGRYDIPAAAKYISQRFPGLPFDYVGHSVGGQFVGLAGQEVDIRRVAFLASGSGHWAYHPGIMRFKVMMFWYYFGPTRLALLGHIPQGKIWRGDDLPRGVFRDWRRWASRGDYFTEDLRDEGLLEAMQSLKAPIRAWLADDDDLMSEGSTRWLLDFYRDAPSELQVIRASSTPSGKVGHDGFFRMSLSEVFWPQIWRWLAEG